ncbi:MAG TPA: CHRD domain-containing protein [Gemmatimonadaceae bacterium]|nr:CHRD domain-containing protein [Gemmatimonadaceae bacterium]
MLMRVSSRIAVGAMLVIVAGCAKDPASSPTEVIKVPIYERTVDDAGVNGGAIHEAHVNLRGENEVPARETAAKGEATFVVSQDGQSVHYILTVSQIDNPFMAHIHMAAAGVNGPIVQWLFPSTAVAPGPLGSGLTNGMIAKGDFTAATFVGPLAGKTMADLLNAIRAGNAYVNVHTSSGVPGDTPHPGNFPGGEIREQLP